MQTQTLTLEQQRTAFKNQKFLATPLAGLIAWLIIGVAGMTLPDTSAAWVLFIGTGSIVYLAMFISKFTGEDFLKKKQRNVFDALFLFTVGQSFLTFAIAIPFFLMDHTSLPLTVGILTGTMWLPFSWIIQHWVGLFHGILRTVVVLILWYVFPELRFVTIPFAIVLIYILTLVILRSRKL